jgi:hypothetical protein
LYSIHHVTIGVGFLIVVVVVIVNPFASEPMSIIDPDEEIRLPLSLEGSIVRMVTGSLTQQELETCSHIILSSPEPWNPADLNLSAATATPILHHTNDSLATKSYFILSIWGEQVVDLYQFESIFDLDEVNWRLILSVQVHNVPRKQAEQAQASAVSIPDPPVLKTFVSKEGIADVSPASLAEWWFISPKQAAETLKETTQNMI